MDELEKREELQSGKDKVFQMIEHRLLDNLTPTEAQNQYIMDSLGVLVTYTIREVAKSEKVYTDSNSRDISRYLNFDLGGLSLGSFVDADIKLHNKSIFGGLMNFVMDVKKIENKLVYELKKELGEL